MADFDLGAWTDASRFGNGEIPIDELDEVPRGGLDRDRGAPNVMEPHAAANKGLLLGALEEAGMTLAIHYSYRTLATQQLKWDKWQAYDAFQKGTGPPAPQANLAAKPGHSNHGWALAVDFDIDVRSDPRFTWLQDNAQGFGFHNDDATTEPWHWDYEGGGPAEVEDMTPEEKQALKDARKFLETLEAALEAAGPQAAAKAVATAVKKTHGHPHEEPPQS
jgi:hypothetical protein